MLDDRDEIDGRRKRCDDALLHPGRHDAGFPPTPGMPQALKIVERGIEAGREKKRYEPDGRWLKKFRDRKHALKHAMTSQEYDDALIAFVMFTKQHGDDIIADIRAGMKHEAEECGAEKS